MIYLIRLRKLDPLTHVLFLVLFLVLALLLRML
jgi:hypothetical protein